MFDWFKKNKENNKLSKEDRAEKGSDRPWVTIIGETVDPEKGIKIELDWNQPFIKYLRENGYSGADDNAVIAKWLIHLYKHISESMSDKNKNYE